MGTAQCVAAEIAELAILRAVAAGTGPGARIDNRSKRVGVEPLDGSRLSHARDRTVVVQWDAGNHAGILRAAALNDAVSVGGIRRAQDRKWQAAVPKDGAGELPSVQRLGQRAIPDIDRQLVNVLGCEVMPHVVVAGTILAAQLTRQR